MHTHDKSQKCVKMVENVSWQPFLRVFDSYHMCAHIIACCQLFPNAWMHSWVSAPVFRPDHLFSTYIQLFFSGFYLFPTVLTSYLSILPIFDCLHLFSTIFKCYCFFFPFFISFSIIFIHFLLYLTILTHFSSLSLIFHHCQPSQLIFDSFVYF